MPNFQSLCSGCWHVRPDSSRLIVFSSPRLCWLSRLNLKVLLILIVWFDAMRAIAWCLVGQTQDFRRGQRWIWQWSGGVHVVFFTLGKIIWKWWWVDWYWWCFLVFGNFVSFLPSQLESWGLGFLFLCRFLNFICIVYMFLDFCINLKVSFSAAPVWGNSVARYSASRGSLWNYVTVVALILRSLVWVESFYVCNSGVERLRSLMRESHNLLSCNT